MAHSKMSQDKFLPGEALARGTLAAFIASKPCTFLDSFSYGTMKDYQQPKQP